MGKGMGLTSTRKGKDSGKWQRDDPRRDRRAAGTDRPWTNPLNLHGDRRRAGTDRRTGRGHRGDPEKEKECRDRWTGRSYRYDPKVRDGVHRQTDIQKEDTGLTQRGKRSAGMNRWEEATRLTPTSRDKREGHYHWKQEGPAGYSSCEKPVGTGNPTGTHLQLLEGIVHVGDLVLLVHGGLVTEEADDGTVSEAEELHLLMILAGEGAALGPQDSIQGEGAVALHNVGQLEAGCQRGLREGAAALGAVTGALRLLAHPMLHDAAAAEVVLAAQPHRVLVDAQADGAQQLILEAARHGCGLGRVTQGQEGVGRGPQGQGGLGTG